MPTSIQAHLLYAGHAAQLGDVLSFTEQWISHNLRPDLPSNEYLPDIGDSPLSGNIISVQSVVANKLPFLVCKTVTEQEYLEGNVRGTIYTVQYDDSLEDEVNQEPTQDDDVVILSISSGAQVDTYTKDPLDKKSQKLYIKEGSTYVEGKNLTINKITCLTNVSTTKRYRNQTAQQIIALGAKAGKVNTSTMWGQAAGCVLYNGHTATPIQEVVNDVVAINWNVTNNYSIKYIPSLTTSNEPTWDHIFYNGIYSKLYKDATGSQYMLLYARDTLPDDLS
jgi:hypothetical protein